MLGPNHLYLSQLKESKKISVIILVMYKYHNLKTEWMCVCVCVFSPGMLVCVRVSAYVCLCLCELVEWNIVTICDCGRNQPSLHLAPFQEIPY